MFFDSALRSALTVGGLKLGDIVTTLTAVFFAGGWSVESNSLVTAFGNPVFYMFTMAAVLVVIIYYLHGNFNYLIEFIALSNLMVVLWNTATIISNVVFLRPLGVPTFSFYVLNLGLLGFYLYRRSPVFLSRGVQDYGW